MAKLGAMTALRESPTDHQETDLQALCNRASERLVATDYLGAEALLVKVKGLAEGARDFDTLSRLLYPLQEARRQRRQRCGEGVVRLDLRAETAEEGAALLGAYPQGQLLVSGWKTTAPAEALRLAAAQAGAFLDVFLGARLSVSGGAEVTVVLPKPAELSRVPDGLPLDGLLGRLPPHAVVLGPGELPGGERRGSPATFAVTMGLWERLHRPYLALADQMPVGLERLRAYDEVLMVDYACELAHQNAAEVARLLSRSEPA